MRTTLVARSFVIVICVWGGLSAAQAEVVRNLYEASVPVISQDRQQRKLAIRQGFAEVLVRVTGRSNVAMLLELDDVYKTAARYVQQYRYRRIPKQQRSNTDLQTSRILWVRFNKKAVNKMLRQRNLPVWGRTRPAALVWFVVENNGQREFVGNHAGNPVYETIRSYAAKRGLPVRFPLLDLNDRTQLQTSDVWANFEGVILKASERYHTDAVIVGRAVMSFSGQWQSRWTLYLKGRRQDWEFQSELLSNALIPGVEQLTDSLSTRFAQLNTSQESNSILLQVNNIKNLADYSRVVQYISSLSVVAKVQPYLLNKNHVIFKLRTRTGRLGVAQAVELGHMLVNEAYETPTIPEQITHKNNNTEGQDVPKVIPDLRYRLL